MSTRHSFLSTTGLIRAPLAASTYSTYAPSNATKHSKPPKTKSKPKLEPVKALKKVIPKTRAGVISLGPTFIVIIAVAFSLLFIASISFAFIGSEEQPEFKDLLDDVARNNPGVSLLSFPDVSHERRSAGGVVRMFRVD